MHLDDLSADRQADPDAGDVIASMQPLEDPEDVLRVVRLDADGNAVREGSQIEIGGNDRYVSLCRKHFKATYFKR